MEFTHISDSPALEHPTLIAAFGGWNDAADAATWAVKFLINQWDAQPFAEIDPETFFDFSESRPQVRVAGGAIRQMSWPSNRFYARREPPTTDEERHDIVLFLGEEPQLRWRTFTQEMLEVCQQVGIEQIILLGALVAEVPHTAPVQISGTATRAPILRQMSRNGIERANYNGSTGILTVIQDSARKMGMPTVSLWGVAPHYISATPNLPVSEALLRKLDILQGFNLQLKDLSRAAQRFNQRVSSLVAEDPDVSAYVHELEQRTTGSLDDISLLPDASGIHRVPVEGELPSPEQAIEGVEEWLRNYREGFSAE